MCDSKCCRVISEKDDEIADDEKTRILIFGVTGVTGGAIADSCVNSAFTVTHGFTRADSTDEYISLLEKRGINIIHGDMMDYHTVLAAMEGMDVVFLTTHYWETLNSGNEVIQGYNVVNAAMEAGVRYLVYAGTDYTIMTTDEKCSYLEGKEKIETYIVNSGIPYTILRIGFYFENLLGLFKPHKVQDDAYALAFPMGNKGLNMISALDVAHCTCKMMLREKFYVNQTIQLSTTYMTVDEMANAMTAHFKEHNMLFFNPQMTIDEYRTLDFDEVEEMTAMWKHYCHTPKYDQDVAIDLAPTQISFARFLKLREKDILMVLRLAEQEANIPEMKWLLGGNVQSKAKDFDALSEVFTTATSTQNSRRCSRMWNDSSSTIKPPASTKPSINQSNTPKSSPKALWKKTTGIGKSFTPLKSSESSIRRDESQPRTSSRSRDGK